MTNARRITPLLAILAAAFATQAAAEIVFYEQDGFQGRYFTTNRQIGNFERSGFNDRASSVIVLSERWEVCEHAQFGGRCVVLRPGRYPSLSSIGMNNRISSVRSVSRSARVDDNRYAPQPPLPVYDNRRRGGERVYEAKVVSVRAVVGPPERRCWVEREQVSGSEPNVSGALIGAVIGGVLGHQVGSGRGNDAATVAGAVGGAVVGSNVGREGGRYQEVQRCTNVARPGRPEFWDVTYVFRGQEHRVQMTSPPGATVTVNGRGEPRA